MTGVLFVFSIAVAIVIILVVRKYARKIQGPSRQEVATIIESFLNGTAESRAWDDFTSVPLSDPELERIRIRCAQLPKEFPPESASAYCNEQGIVVLKTYAQLLKKNQQRIQ